MEFMKNPYVVQSVGLIITAIGALVLIALMTLYGKPLSEEETTRLGRENRGAFRLPINIETIVATIILLGGIGILTWSKFDLCTFTAHWLPDLPGLMMRALQC